MSCIKPLHDIVGIVEHLRKLLAIFHSIAKKGNGIVGAIGERVESTAKCRLYLGDIGKHVAVLFKLILLACLKIHCIELFKLEAGEVLVLTVLLDKFLCITQTLQCAPIGDKAPRVVGKQLFISCKSVDNAKLKLRRRKQTVVMLGMDIYQKHGHVGEEVERHRRVVDEGPRASGRGNLPAQDTDIIIPLDIICHTVLFQPLVVVKFESGLDYRFATRIAHSFQVGPLAKYERQSAEHD